MNKGEFTKKMEDLLDKHTQVTTTLLSVVKGNKEMELKAVKAGLSMYTKELFDAFDDMAEDMMADMIKEMGAKDN